MHWDDIAAQYELVELRSFLDGQIVVGYPPAVGSVDVNVTGSSILGGHHLIGRVSPQRGVAWTFAVEWIEQAEILALPCNRRLILGSWMIDLDAAGRLLEAPIDPVRGSIHSSGETVYLWSLHEVACFERNGQRWKRKALFGGDLMSVVMQSGRLACLGYIDWVEPGRLFTLLLDPETGQISGGDPEALSSHRADGDLLV